MDLLRPNRQVLYEIIRNNSVTFQDSVELSGKIIFEISAEGNNFYYEAKLDTTLSAPQNELRVKVDLQRGRPISYEGWALIASEDIKSNNVKILLFGETKICPPLDEENVLAKRYGFAIVHMGCDITVDKYGRSPYKGNNDVINKYLDQRNGPGWRKKYTVEKNELCEKFWSR
jgi:hypothetical protein